METKTKIIIAVVSIVIIIAIFIILFLTLRHNTSIKLTGGYNDYYEDENFQSYKLIDDDIPDDFVKNVKDYKNFHKKCEVVFNFDSDDSIIIDNEYSDDNSDEGLSQIDLIRKGIRKSYKNIITNKNAYKLVFGDDYVSPGHQRLAVVYPNDISKKIVINKTITVNGKEYEVVFPRSIKKYFFKNDYLESFEITDLLHPTTNIQSLSGLFAYCTNLKNIKLCNNFVTNNVTKMDHMLNNISIDNIDFMKNFNFSNVTNINYMFTKSKLEHIDLSAFDVSSVNYMDYLFSHSKKLKSIKMPKFNGDNDALKLYAVFSSCPTLSKIDFMNFNLKSNNIGDDMFERIYFSHRMSKYPKNKNTLNVFLILANFDISIRTPTQLTWASCKLYDINCNNSYFGYG